MTRKTYVPDIEEAYERFMRIEEAAWYALLYLERRQDPADEEQLLFIDILREALKGRKREKAMSTQPTHDLQEYQRLFEAVEQFRRDNPDFNEALRFYKDAQYVLLAKQSYQITISTSTDESGAIFSYLPQMQTHPQLAKATAWILTLHRTVKERGWEWIAPLVPVSESDELLLEWWQRQKKLSVYFDAEDVTAYRIAGQEMSEEPAGNGVVPYSWLIDQS